MKRFLLCLSMFHHLAYTNAYDLANVRKGCNLDTDCNPEAYCLKGWCEPCISCASSFNREPKPNLFRECVKSISDCSKCLNGHSFHPTEGNENQHGKCLLDEKQSWLNLLLLLFILAVAIVLCITAFFICKKFKWSKGTWKSLKTKRNQEEQSEGSDGSRASSEGIPTVNRVKASKTKRGQSRGSIETSL